MSHISRGCARCLSEWWVLRAKDVTVCEDLVQFAELVGFALLVKRVIVALFIITDGEPLPFPGPAFQGRRLRCFARVFIRKYMSTVQENMLLNILRKIFVSVVVPNSR